MPIYEPGIERLLERNRDRLTFTQDMRGAVRAAARVVFVCVDTPPTHSGDADLSRVHRVIDELPADGERFVLVMKSTVPVGTGDKVRAELDARGLGARRLRVQPRVPARGARHRRLHGARPDRDRRAERRRRRGGGGAVRRPERDRRAHRPGQRRDDQVRVERVPGDQDLVHQRDRERLRGGGGRRLGSVPRDGTGRADRRRTSCAPASATAAAAWPATSWSRCATDDSVEDVSLAELLPAARGAGRRGASRRAWRCWPGRSATRRPSSCRCRR